MKAKQYLLLALLTNCPSSLTAQEFGERCFHFLGDYPGDANPGWHEDAQGVAHDAEHWFFTQTKAIWKIPVGHDLNAGSDGFSMVSLDDVEDLVEDGYVHMGDPECFVFDGQTFVLVPMEKDDNQPPPAIAFFRGDSLDFVVHVHFPHPTHGSWCATDAQGLVYAANSDDNLIRKYSVNWEKLLTDRTQVQLTLQAELPLRNENGNPMAVPYLQGGCVTPSGGLLYLVAGTTDAPIATDGITVFDLSTGRKVKQSTQTGQFAYEFYPDGPDPGSHDDLWDEEPEGITFWDLDDGRAPGISGQLHAILLDNDWPDPDEIYFKHYAGTLHVNRNYTGLERGSLREPFNSVSEANYQIWDGAQIKIKSASYPEMLTFSKRISVLPDGGPVTIGE